MIQRYIFDSSTMDIKKISNSILIFITKRLIEISGIIIAILGILLFLALISYSPEDPNFIFPENLEIKNYLGFQGSYTSDLFLQSVGIISFLIPITFILTGINIFRKKEIFLFLENIFFITIYTIVGSLFFSYFYSDSFNLYINGNGGFIGKYLNGTFLNSFIALGLGPNADSLADIFILAAFCLNKLNPATYFSALIFFGLGKFILF